MRTTSRLAVSAAVLGGSLLLAAPVSAQDATPAPCPYPFDNCPTAPPPTTAPPVGGATENPATGETPAPGGGAVVDNSPVRGSSGGAGSLPFTGGEVTLIALAGTAALAGGVVLVAAGRRRATS